MIVPVFTPPSRIDATNVAEFANTVHEFIARHGCMVIDRSKLVWIAASGMHVMEMASYEAPITLVNPNPTVHLIAATFGGDIQCRYERATSPASVSEVPTPRLLSFHADGQVAS